ncbi:hypothetical protein [Heyndrickxia camelliae]|nr:hypothetical protein [Heyndrickxia camelliae]
MIRTEVKSACHDAESMFESLYNAFLDVIHKGKGSIEKVAVIALGVPG